MTNSPKIIAVFGATGAYPAHLTKSPLLRDINIILKGDKEMLFAAPY